MWFICSDRWQEPSICLPMINHAETKGIAEAPLWCVAPPVFTALGCVVLFFYGGEISAFLSPLGEVN